jgi:hypothetical protein
MVDENNKARGYQQPAEPAPDLRALDRLVGEWEVSGTTWREHRPSSG